MGAYEVFFLMEDIAKNGSKAQPRFSYHVGEWVTIPYVSAFWVKRAQILKMGPTRALIRYNPTGRREIVKYVRYERLRKTDQPKEGQN
jgi:hypothetical protein